MKEILSGNRTCSSRALQLDLRIDRQQHRRVVGRRIRVREAPAEGAPIPHLRVSDRRRRVRHDGTLVAQHGGGGDVVMHGAGPYLNHAITLPNPGEAGNPRDVDDRGRLVQPQLHQRDQTVPAGNQLAGSAGRSKFRQGVVDRSRTLVLEGGRNHD